MNKKIFLLLTFFVTINIVTSQNEEFTNTYVYTFNEYFYPWGNNPLDTTSYGYNPYNQFSLFYPYDRDSCLPSNTDSDPYNDSRFNIINYNFPIVVDGWYPDLYCNRGIESGPGVNNSGSIRISIRGINDNAGGIPNDGTDDRSRVEMIYYPKHWNGSNYTNDVNGQTYYYRWNFFIPEGVNYIEQNGEFDIITQFHQPNWRETFDPITGIRSDPANNSVNLIEGEQPPLLITYDDLNGKSDIVFLYGYRRSYLGNSQYPDGSNGCRTGSSCDRSSNFKIENIINKGEWNTIILKIKWSPNDSDGYMKAWVNGVSAINNDSTLLDEINNPNHPYINNIEELKKIRGANMLKTQDGEVLSNFMQMGHYRGHGANANVSIYFDDLIITQDENLAFNGFKTSLKSDFCGNVLSNTNPIIEATPLPKISQYKFRFEEVGNESNFIEVERDTNKYNIFDNEDYFTPNKEYIVKVFVKVIGEDSYRNYDSNTNCKIRVDSYTKLKDDFCSCTLPIEDLHIECYPVINATNYKFRFESTTSPEILWKDSPTPNVDLRFDDRFKPNMKYNVKVRAQSDTFDFDYGEICDIRIPRFTKIIDNTICNQTLSVGDYLSCYKIPGATNYKFRFKNIYGVHKWIDSSVPKISIPFSWYFITGGDYVVQIRMNGAYGAPCNFKINSLFHLKNTNNKKPELFNIKISPNPFTKSIILPDFKNNIIVKIYSSTGKLMFNKPLQKSNNEIDLSHFSKGIYFISIISKNKIYNSKLIKK